MWAGVVVGKNLHACARKEKHENINDRVPGRAGYNRFGTNTHRADWTAKAGESNAYTATDLTTARGPGSRSASVPRRESAPDA